MLWEKMKEEAGAHQVVLGEIFNIFIFILSFGLNNYSMMPHSESQKFVNQST